MPQPLTVGSALTSYYKEHISVKAVARRRAEYAIEALSRHLGAALLKDVDIPMCREYAEDRSDEGCSLSTVRRELGVLQAAVNHALRWKRLAYSEKPSVELPPESDPKRVWLFPEELGKLLECASVSDRRVFRFLQLAYHTASRKNAIETLTWARVDLVSRRIDLQDPGKSRTKKRRPIVPISEIMAQELAAMKVTAVNTFVLASDRDIRAAFDRVAKIAGLAALPSSGLRESGRLTPHTLRHSRATHMLQAGKSPWLVANLLGDSLTTVLRVYGHACPDYLEGALS